MMPISKTLVRRGAGATGLAWKFLSSSSGGNGAAPQVLNGSSALTSGSGPIRFRTHRRTMASYSGKDTPAFPPPTYDDMPVPSGSWADEFKKKNRRYNKQLFFGLASIIFTIFFYYRSDKIFFNASPPKLPYEELELEACKPEPEECK